MVAALKDVSVEQADALDFNSQIGIVENLGKVLFDKYLIPFELVSVLFLSAMVGAVMLGKREAGERII
jgi:NADH-quinone oxidoreductase subunit J